MRRIPVPVDERAAAPTSALQYRRDDFGRQSKMIRGPEVRLGAEFSTESLILAQDERWRRA